MTLNELVKLTMLWTTGPWMVNDTNVSISNRSYSSMYHGDNNRKLIKPVCINLYRMISAHSKDKKKLSMLMNSHKFNIRNMDGPSFSSNVAIHFNSNEHSMRDFSFMPIDQFLVICKDCCKRHVGSTNWILYIPKDWMLKCFTNLNWAGVRRFLPDGVCQTRPQIRAAW